VQFTAKAAHYYSAALWKMAHQTYYRDGCAAAVLFLELSKKRQQHGPRWVHLPSSQNSVVLDPHNGISNRVHYLRLSFQLGRGAEGSVYFAQSVPKNGVARAGVVKIFHKGIDLQCVLQEVALWQEFGGAAGKLVWSSGDFCSRMCLVMPYLETVRAGITPSVEIQQATCVTMKMWAAAGWVHTDLHWRHVAFYTGSDGGKQVVFIDLSNAKRAAPEVALREMMSALEFTTLSP
jgi:hypothetical protein